MCFVVSIFSIGVVTAVIGDVASHFGCTLGIKDSVTAIVFVALGTSIPGAMQHLIANCDQFSMKNLYTILLNFFFQIHLLVRWPRFKTNTQTLVLAM